MRIPRSGTLLRRPCRRQGRSGRRKRPSRSTPPRRKARGAETRRRTRPRAPRQGRAARYRRAAARTSPQDIRAVRRAARFPEMRIPNRRSSSRLVSAIIIARRARRMRKCAESRRRTALPRPANSDKIHGKIAPLPSGTRYGIMTAGGLLWIYPTHRVSCKATTASKRS